MKKEVPILFSTPMIQAILEKRKHQTRRIAKGQALKWLEEGFTPEFVADPDNNLCPYGKVGDILYCRETWAKTFRYWYKADDIPYHDAAETVYDVKWKPSIHMPKSAARIYLEIEDISVERLQDISEEDAIAEGIRNRNNPSYPADFNECPTCGGQFVHGAFGKDYGLTEVDCTACDTAKKQFQFLWQSINGEESWMLNLWVWVVKFRVLSTTGRPDSLPSL